MGSAQSGWQGQWHATGEHWFSISQQMSTADDFLVGLGPHVGIPCPALDRPGAWCPCLCELLYTSVLLYLEDTFFFFFKVIYHFWLLKSSHLLFCRKAPLPLNLELGWDVSFRTKYVQLWISVLIPIYCKKLSWWGLSLVLIHGYNNTSEGVVTIFL